MFKIWWRLFSRQVVRNDNFSFGAKLKLCNCRSFFRFWSQCSSMRPVGTHLLNIAMSVRSSALQTTHLWERKRCFSRRNGQVNYAYTKTCPIRTTAGPIEMQARSHGGGHRGALPPLEITLPPRNSAMIMTLSSHSLLVDGCPVHL